MATYSFVPSVVLFQQGEWLSLLLTSSSPVVVSSMSTVVCRFLVLYSCGLHVCPYMHAEIFIVYFLVFCMIQEIFHHL